MKTVCVALAVVVAFVVGVLVGPWFNQPRRNGESGLSGSALIVRPTNAGGSVTTRLRVSDNPDVDGEHTDAWSVEIGGRMWVLFEDKK